MAEEPGGQRHVQISPCISGPLWALNGNVSGDTILKAQVERKMDPSTPKPTSMETPSEFRRPVLAILWTFIILSLVPGIVFAGTRREEGF